MVGKSTKHLSRDAMILYTRLMYQVRMGYVALDKPSAFQSIAYYPEEHIFDHDLSIQSIGRQYQVRKLADKIPLDLFLNLPIEHTNTLIRGMLIGAEDLEQLEKDALAEQKRLEELSKDKAGQNFNKLHDK